MHASLKKLLTRIASASVYSETIKAIKVHPIQGTSDNSGLPEAVALESVYGSLRSLLLANLARDLGMHVCVLTAAPTEARRISGDFAALDHPHALLAGDELLSSFYASPAFDERLQASFAGGGVAASVASTSANKASSIPSPKGKQAEAQRYGLWAIAMEDAFKELPAPSDAHKPLSIQGTIPKGIADTLAEMGYLRVSKVAFPGEFALRGEVLDIYFEPYDHPWRIVYAWNEIEQIYPFHVATQERVGESISQIQIPSRSNAVGIEDCKQGAFFEHLPENTLIVRIGNLGALAEYYEYLLEPAISRFGRQIEIVPIKGTYDNAIDWKAREGRSFFSNMSYLREELSVLSGQGYLTILCAGEGVQTERLKKMAPGWDIQPLGLTQGFNLPHEGVCIITEHEVFGRVHASLRSVKSEAALIDSFLDLEPGDLVVHVHHGIGRFVALTRMKALGSERDFMEIAYAADEKIFLPIEQAHLIQRYLGSEEGKVELDTLGSKSWKKRKETARKSAEHLAKRLIALYAKRQQAKGFSFPPDNAWQAAFEGSFPYDETPDQLQATQEIKEDMESPRPMDRLLCGDVGFGKTEVAFRTAFKAVMGGKQVVLLAPTTILAEQHYKSFKERVKDFPVKVGMLSRLVTAKEKKQVLEGLKEGSIDVVVGTHAVLSRNIVFKNLGLLIVDEEQRFGVKHKERLKELRVNLDTLTLSATPIPRTLHMTLLSIRDISLLKTPPSKRQAIKTYIEPFAPGVIAQAIRREMDREGQVFYLHNRIESLAATKALIESLVPEALVSVAHGQMSPAQLEERMESFIKGGSHVLLATTIIENGIDIPNVNTIIIDRADNYGVSQLYQLRGRVGRSDRKAYAYLLFPNKRELSEIATRRLQVISEASELGAGFTIAMKDLELRGAGNMLGREQSGHMFSVGLDLYLKILHETVEELTGEKKADSVDTVVELSYTGYIPDDYIEAAVTKMEIYKTIAGATSLDTLERIAASLTDRFGPMPPEIEPLFDLAEIRLIAGVLQIHTLKDARVSVRGTMKRVLKVKFGKLAVIPMDQVLRLIRQSGGAIRPDAKDPQLLLADLPDENPVRFVRDFLRQMLN